MSDDGTEWADCAICDCSTDPSENPPGGRDNRDVVVAGEPGNVTSLTRTVLIRGTRSVSRITGSGVSRRVMGP